MWFSPLTWKPTSSKMFTCNVNFPSRKRSKYRSYHFICNIIYIYFAYRINTTMHASPGFISYFINRFTMSMKQTSWHSPYPTKTSIFHQSLIIIICSGSYLANRGGSDADRNPKVVLTTHVFPKPLSSMSQKTLFPLLHIMYIQDSSSMMSKFWKLNYLCFLSANQNWVYEVRVGVLKTHISALYTADKHFSTIQVSLHSCFWQLIQFYYFICSFLSVSGYSYSIIIIMEKVTTQNITILHALWLSPWLW